MQIFKIIFIALSIFSIGGAILAFKTTKLAACAYTSTEINRCTILHYPKTTTTVGFGTSYYATVKFKVNGVCPAPPVGGFNCPSMYYLRDE